MDELSRRSACEVLDDHLNIANDWVDKRLLEWSYRDATVEVRDGVDSYLIENGKIVAQTIHYILEAC